MVALKIIGIVFAAVLLLFALILSVRFDIVIRKSEEKGFQLLFSVFGIVFGEEKKGKPKKQKPKQKKTEKKEDNVLVAAVKRLFGFSHLEKDGEKRSIGDVIETVKETANSVTLIVNKVFWAVRHCRLRKLNLVFISGGDDAAKAAMDYGVACSVLYPMLGLLQSRQKRSPKELHVEIRCDFEREKTEFYLDTEISLRVYYLFIAAMKIVMQNIRNTFSKEEDR